MKFHLASKSTAAGPRYTGHSGEVSTPHVSTPPKPLKTGADRDGFPNRKAIVDKALERFLSFENPLSRLPVRYRGDKLSRLAPQNLWGVSGRGYAQNYGMFRDMPYSFSRVPKRPGLQA